MKQYNADEVSGQVLVLTPTKGETFVNRQTIELPKRLYKNSRVLAETSTTVTDVNHRKFRILLTKIFVDN